VPADGVAGAAGPEASETRPVSPELGPEDGHHCGAARRAPKPRAAALQRASQICESFIGDLLRPGESENGKKVAVRPKTSLPDRAGH
jgi:hypothetical protein